MRSRPKSSRTEYNYSMQGFGRRRIAAIVVVSSIASAGYGYYRYCYPYGRSHCCDMALWLQLRLYAQSHDGWFPKGESSSEASLSLLYH